MRWAHTTLGTFNRNKEEIKFFARRGTDTLNKITVNDTTTGRVVKSTLTINDKEGLNDPLVYNQESDLWSS